MRYHLFIIFTLNMSLDRIQLIKAVDNNLEDGISCSLCTYRNLCKSINGLYTNPSLFSKASTAVFIVQIPSGACGIFIRQLKPSTNLLTIQLENGTIILKGKRDFNGQQFVTSLGTVFSYVRKFPKNIETVTAYGPIKQPINILILANEANRGIQYRYALPANSINRLIQHKNGKRNLRRHLYYWRKIGLSSCTGKCGNGTQKSLLSCVHGLTNTVVSAHYCHNISKPITIPIKCNTEKCLDGKWLMTEWSDCSFKCGLGYQKRLIYCSSANCNETERPTEYRNCYNKKKCALGQWFTGPWSNCVTTCKIDEAIPERSRLVFCVIFTKGRPHITNDKTCLQSDKPFAKEACPLTSCNAFNWYFDNWSNCLQCPLGIQKRKLKCLNKSQKTANNCNEQLRPITITQCNCVKDKINTLEDVQSYRNGSCVDAIANCYLAVQARLCKYQYYVQNCCYSCQHKLKQRK